jgi:VWFA-related protein
MTVLDGKEKVGLSNKTARRRSHFSLAGWLAAAFGGAVLIGSLIAAVPATSAQSGQNQQTQPTGTQPSQTQSTQQDNIPDAPAVQPAPAQPEPLPTPKPEEEEKKKPASNLNPWTNQPNPTTPPASQPNDATDSGATTPPPPMPPVKTVPPGSTAKKQSGQEELYTLVVHTNFVQMPVTVKDRDGRMVDGLLPTDFVVKENGVVQKLTFFSADPFALSVAIVLDLGMPDADVQKINKTFSALVGAFAPYDEVSLYTYSSTVTQASDFVAANQRLTAVLNQIKTDRGRNNGVPVTSGPLAPNGPIINGMPVGSPTQPVYTPPKESHVLNDAILRAGLDLRKRGRERRKVILVISDGREYGSEASYRDVLKMLLSNEIQVRAIAVDSGALPVYSKLERLHLPKQGYDEILPKYVNATGGAPVFKELTRSAIDDIYAQVTSEARNQYTLGYYPSKPKTPTSAPYHSIEILVDRPGLKIYAKDGYYPAIQAAR